MTTASNISTQLSQTLCLKSLQLSPPFNVRPSKNTWQPPAISTCTTLCLKRLQLSPLLLLCVALYATASKLNLHHLVSEKSTTFATMIWCVWSFACYISGNVRLFACYIWLMCIKNVSEVLLATSGKCACEVFCLLYISGNVLMCLKFCLLFSGNVRLKFLLGN
jgi:hypothetical protein